MAHIQVNKLIGDLHKQFLEQGSNKVILAFSLPYSIVSAKEALENVNAVCDFKELRALIQTTKSGDSLQFLQK